jgi:hypothetical protein
MAISYYTWFVFVRVAVCVLVFVCMCVLSACHWQYILLIVSPGHVEIVSSRVRYMIIEFHFLHCVHYNSVIAFLTNECTRFYSDHSNITTHQPLHVLGLIGPLSVKTQLYKTIIEHFPHVAELPKTPQYVTCM